MLDFKSALKVLFRGKQKGSVWDDRYFYGITDKGNFQNDGEELSAIEKIAWVAIAVCTVARDISSQEMYFENQNGDTVEGRALPRELFDFLYPSNKRNLSAMLKNIVIQRKLTGNAYWWLTENTMYNTVYGTKSIIPLNPADVKILLSSDGYNLMGYDIKKKDGTRIRVSPEDLMHFNQDAIYDGYTGIGDIAKMRVTSEVEFESEVYAKNFVKNRAMPSMIVTEKSDGLTQEDFERKRQMLKSGVEGAKNAGQALYLAGDDLNIVTMGLSQKDMQYLEGKSFNRQTILSMFGVPPVIVGIPESANKAIAREMRLNYYSMLNRSMVEYEEVINNQYVKNIEPNLKYRIARYGIADIDDVILKINNGIITPNEASRQLGEEFDDSNLERNTYYMQSSLLPMGYMEEVPEETEKSNKNFPVEIDLGKFDLSNPKNVDAIVGNFHQKAFRQKRFQAKYLKASLMSRNKTEDKYAYEFSKFFKEQGKRVVKRLEDAYLGKKATFDPNLSPSDVTAVIFNLDYEEEAVKKLADSVHTSVVKKAVEDINKLTGSSINSNISNPFILGAIEGLRPNLTGKTFKNGKFGSVNQTTTDAIRNTIKEGMENGLNIDVISKDITKKFDEFAGYRARRIARTEARAGWDAGALVSYQELGADKVDVIGCDGTSTEASYGTQDETYGDCGRTGIPIAQAFSLEFHPNHIGSIAPEKDML